MVDIDFTPPFRRISMCSGLEEALDMKLPADLDSEEARLFLVELVSVALCLFLWVGAWRRSPGKRGGLRVPDGAGELAGARRRLHVAPDAQRSCPVKPCQRPAAVLHTAHTCGST